MSVSPEVLTIVRQWVEKAEHDLANAEHTLTMKEECPYDTVCFHAQQCVEKYVKALLVFHGVDFPKTHDIGELIARLPRRIRVRVQLTFEAQRRLTDYATLTRYPGDYEEIPIAETRRAVRIARRTRLEIRRLLPKEVRT